MAAKSNTPKTPNFDTCLYLIKLRFQLWGFFISHPNYTFFSAKRLKSWTTLTSRNLENVTKFQLLGDYMIATPFYHLALVSSNRQLRVKTCGWHNLAQNPYFGTHPPRDLPYTKPPES
jgi:hypothetical protein